MLIRGAARAQLSALFVRRLQQREPATPPGKLEKARTMPLTAPLVIAVGAHLRANHKVPEIEQLLSTGAAVMNLLNAFHAHGLWRDLADGRQRLRSARSAGSSGSTPGSAAWVSSTWVRCRHRMTRCRVARSGPR